MPSGIGYGASQGMEAVLARLFAEQQAKEAQRQAMAREALQLQQLTQAGSQFDQRMGLDRDELGLRREQIAAEAPMKAANLRLLTAQAANMEDLPNQKEADRAFRSQEAELTRAAREEQANRDRDLKVTLAQMQGAANASNRGLRDQMLQMQIDEKRGKMDAAAEVKTKGESEARATTQAALDSVNALMKHPGLNKAQGVFDSLVTSRMSQEAADFNAERDRLVASLTLPNLGALKGPMSDKDIVFIKQVSSKLADPRMSEQAMQAELARVKTFLASKLGASTTQAKPGADLGKDW